MPFHSFCTILTSSNTNNRLFNLWITLQELCCTVRLYNNLGWCAFCTHIVSLLTFCSAQPVWQFCRFCWLVSVLSPFANHPAFAVTKLFCFGAFRCSWKFYMVPTRCASILVYFMISARYLTELKCCEQQLQKNIGKQIRNNLQAVNENCFGKLPSTWVNILVLCS